MAAFHPATTRVLTDAIELHQRLRESAAFGTSSTRIKAELIRETAVVADLQRLLVHIQTEGLVSP